MKGGKKKNGGSADTLTAPSNGVLELVAGEAQQQQQDAGGEEEPVAGEEEEEETYEVEGEGEGEGDDNNEKPKLAEGYYEIEAVRQKRIRKGQVQYLIKWRGWPETENTWEPVKNLMSCSDVIDAFEESLQSGKQRSTRKRKRKSGATHTPVKRKQQQQPQQQQRSPAAATYNVPAVRVRIIEEPTPSPPLSGLKATNRVDSNDSDLNNNKVGRVVIGNGLTLGSSLEETREQNELNLKLSELKGAVSTNDNSVERSGNGLSNGFPKANGVESFQSDRRTGAKRRKSGYVRRFKQDTTSVMDDIQDAAAVGPMATFVQEGSHNHEFMGSDLVCKNKFDDSGDEYTITQIVKPISYSASLSSDMQDVSITFQAKRSDGKDMMVDNKFLKMNNPLLLINFYEQHLRYKPTQ